MSAQKVKQQLVGMPNKDTALALWMKTTFQDYLSIMALVFDRVHTFATPLYGFDQQVLLDATRKERTFLDDRKGVVDLDVLVVDFLRRQEKAGGTDVAVAIVLDTSGLVDDDDENQAPSQRAPGSTNRTVRHKHHHRVELGFAIHQEPKQQPGAPDLPPGRPRSNSLSQRHESHQSSPSMERRESASDDHLKVKQWPAIYLRSTTRLSGQARTSSSVGGATLGLISGMRTNNRSSATLDGPSSSQNGIHVSNSRTSWSSELSPRSRRTSKKSLLSLGNVFEYEAESSNQPSWPHSEWNQLEGLLESMDAGTGTENVVTDRHSASPNASPHRPNDAACKTGNMFEEPVAVSFPFHPDGVDPAVEGEAGGGKPATSPAIFESTGSLFSTDLPKQLWESSSNSHAPTTFHAVHLSNFMYMIGMSTIMWQG